MIKQVIKDINQTKLQAFVFVLSIILSIGVFISVNSLSQNVDSYIQTNTKQLVGGDIIIDSNKPFPEEFLKQLENIQTSYTKSNTYEFTSVVLSNKNQSLLTQVILADNNYPLYGQINATSPIQKNGLIVEPALLSRLNVSVNDTLKLGNKELNIAGVINEFPGRNLDLFQLGPLIVGSTQDIEEIGLISQRSRVDYSIYLKSQASQELYNELQDINTNSQIDIDYYSEDNQTLQEFLNEFLRFIELISFFIIVLCGIAMTSIIFSYLDEKKQTIGIKKTLGETNKNILKYYYLTIIFITLIATAFAVLLSWALISFFPLVFSDLLPKEINPTLSLFSVLEGITIAVIIASVFTLYPLLQLRQIKPLEIFQKRTQSIQKDIKLLSITSVIILVTLLTLLLIEIGDLQITLYLLGGFIGVFLLLYTLTKLTLYLLKKIRTRQIVFVQAIKGLLRIGNKTALIITSIAFSLTIIFTILFLQENLEDQFITSFPEDAPNFVILDVQPNQTTQVEQLLNKSIQFYPVIRGDLLTINGVPSQTVEDQNPAGDSLTRTFSLTYTDLLETEEIIVSRSDSLFVENWDKQEVQVSVLEEIAQRMDAELGDELVFSIQGIEIPAEIVSIRKRTTQGLTPFFYFTFEEEVLKDAPQNVFAMIRVNTSMIPEYQNMLAREFPQITTIDAQNTAREVGDILDEVMSVVTFFTLFSLVAGVLLLFSAIIATNKSRIKESVFYKLVGTPQTTITKIFLVEYALLGVLSSLIAAVVATITTYSISTYILSLPFSIPFINLLQYSFITCMAIIAIGYISSRKILAKKPIEYIQEEEIE